MKSTRSNFARGRLTVPALSLAAALAVVWLGRAQESAVAEVPPAYEVVTLPDHLDSLSLLADAARRIAACDADCAEIVYVWTPRMPLSRSAIPNIDRAARAVGAGLALVGFEELERFAETGVASEPAATELAETLLAAGALTHSPSLVVHDATGAVGAAILGYKTAEAYASMIGRRLWGDVASDPVGADALASDSGVADAAVSGASGATAGSAERAPSGAVMGGVELPDEVAAVAFTDFTAIGVPGAYFKWVPGRRALAYESQRRVYLLDLEDGQNRLAPGTIDFVPSPDGRYFVTPADRRAGLVWVDANDVFEATRRGDPGSVRPIFVDRQMQDQYPSVGILDEDDRSIRYRIMTSWFEGLLYRDYEVVHATDESPATVQPLTDPIAPCVGMELSTPIMSQDGLEVAARDETTGTTTIFRVLEGGRCEEVLPLGMPTRKVAWHSSGRRLAFSTPRVRTSSSGGVEPGIFIYDRDERRITRVADSDGASQLAFPDFLGDDAIVFMIPGRGNAQESRFRIVAPLP